MSDVLTRAVDALADLGQALSPGGHKRATERPLIAPEETLPAPSEALWAARAELMTALNGEHHSDQERHALAAAKEHVEAAIALLRAGETAEQPAHRTATKP